MMRLRLWWERVRYPVRVCYTDSAGVVVVKQLPLWRRLVAKR